MITIQVDIGGAMQMVETGIESVSDLGPIFKRYIPWLRKDIDKVFEQQGPGWKALDEDTMAVRQSKMETLAAKIRGGASGTLRRKLVSEERRIQKRVQKRSASLDLNEFGSNSRKLYDRAQRSLFKKQTQIVELDRIASGGDRSKVLKGADKVVERLGRREGRAEQKIEKLERGELLGQIANSIAYEVTGGNLDVFSRIPWAGVHNKGGTAGHGARMPERTFLKWTPGRIEKFKEIAATYLNEEMNKKK